MLMEIQWSINNILCLIAMIFLVWMGSMIGYSKIIETIQQFRAWQISIQGGQVTEVIDDFVDKTNNN